MTLAGPRVVGVAPDAAGVVGEQVDRDRRLRRGRAHAVDVVGRRDEGVEVAGRQRAALDELDAVAALGVDVLVLGPAVEADEAPREMVVHRRLRAGGHDEREERERAVLGAEEQPLADAAAHAAVGVALLEALGQPVGVGEQLGEGGPDRVAGLRGRSGVLDRGAHAGDEVTHDRGVEQVLVAGHAASLWQEVERVGELEPDVLVASGRGRSTGRRGRGVSRLSPARPAGRAARPGRRRAWPAPRRA